MSTIAHDSNAYTTTMSAGTQHDDKFYFTNVVFMIERTLFRIPRQILEAHSEVFRNMFCMPAGDRATEGSSDQNPIFLEGIASHDFAQLLKVLLGSPVDHVDDLPQSAADWSAVLNLSHLWGMDSIHSFAFEKLSSTNLDPVDKAALGIRHNLPEWVKPALNELARRTQPLCRRDVEKLGLDVVLKLAEVRESIVGATWAGGSIGSTAVGRRTAAHLDFGERIEEVFAEHFPRSLPGDSVKKTQGNSTMPMIKAC